MRVCVGGGGDRKKPTFHERHISVAHHHTHTLTNTRTAYTFGQPLAYAPGPHAKKMDPKTSVQVVRPSKAM